MSVYYSDVKSKYQELLFNKDDAGDTKAYVVGYPLCFLGDFIFKTLFSYIFGFEWFIHLADKLDLAGKKIELRGISYRIAAEHWDAPLVSGFEITNSRFTLTPLNFWAIPLNYIFRHLGKFLGYLLVSPFTVPAYFIIKGIYKVKERWLKNDYHKVLNQIDNSELIKGWIKNPSSLPVEDIAKRYTVVDIAAANRMLDYGDRLKPEDAKQFANRRFAILESLKPWPISNSHRELRHRIEVQQRLLTQIAKDGDLDSVPVTTADIQKFKARQSEESYVKMGSGLVTSENSLGHNSVSSSSSSMETQSPRHSQVDSSYDINLEVDDAIFNWRNSPN